MWIVFDDSNYEAHGPFESREGAEAWLKAQNIDKPYGDHEISVMAVLTVDNHIPM